MTISGLTKSVPDGTLISQGAGANANIYGVMPEITSSATSILLNKPPLAAMANGSVLGVGPSGCYGIAAHRDAIGFVSRPLAMPPAARAFVANYNNLGIRVTIGYDMVYQNTLVTLDLLAGTCTFYPERGSVLFN
jgi:hypothetical protein